MSLLLQSMLQLLPYAAAALLVAPILLCRASSGAGAGPVYVVGADLGTESCRVGLFDINSAEYCYKPLVSHAVPYKTSFPAPGWAEQDPDDWWAALGQACRACCRDIDTSLVKGLCVDTTACSVVALGADYRPLRPCLLWCDVRSSQQCQEMLDRARGDPALRVSSNGRGPVSAEWMIPKALWIKQNEPQTWQRAKFVCEKQDYINFKLSGELVGSSCNVAARWHWDAREAVNSPPGSRGGMPMSLLRSLDLTDLADKWPARVVAMGAKVGTLTSAAAQHLGIVGLGDGVPVIQGGPDAYVGMIGLGAVKEGQLSLITGSSHLHLAVTAGEAASDGIWGAYRGAPLLTLNFAEGGQSATGSALTWAKRLFNATFAELDAEAAAIPPGSGGVLAYEKFQGSRTPRTNPLARAAFVGLSLSHTRGHMWRALLEAICLGTRAAIEGLARAGHTSSEILIAGGATRSEVFVQMHADVTGLPVVLGVFDNSPLLGCAVLAASATRHFPAVGLGGGGGDHDEFAAIAARVSAAVSQMVRVSRVVRPCADSKAAYDKLYHLYRSLEASIEGVCGMLASPLPSRVSSGASESRSGSGRVLVVSPSLLSADTGRLAEEARGLAAAGATVVHIDMCDSSDSCLGSLTYGPTAIAAIHRAAPELFLDVHAVCRPATTRALLEQLHEAGVSRLILQVEQFQSTKDFVDLASRARDLGMAVGACLEPHTPVGVLDELLSARHSDSPLVEMINVLAVGCGVAGQMFDDSVLPKVKHLFSKHRHTLRHIAVDGGITSATAAQAAEAGANLLVSGSFIFKDVYAHYNALVEVLSRFAV